MVFIWTITIYLLEGCIISLFLFLIASAFIPALKKIRPHYLHNANIPFAILGLIMLVSSVLLHLIVIYFASVEYYKEVPPRRNYRAEMIVMISLLCGIVPALAFSRKRNTSVWFTCLLLISVSIIAHIIEIMQWLLNVTGIEQTNYPDFYGPEANWYRISAAVLIFVVPYWFARRKISHA